MTKSFREHHLFSLLSFFSSHNLPLDAALKKYFSAHRAIGAKDRKFISETIYAMIRWQGLIDFFCSPPIFWEKRYQLFIQNSWVKAKNDPSVPPHIRVSFPKSFFHMLSACFGESKAIEICSISNEQAPITVRVNPSKTDRETLLNSWRTQFSVKPTPLSKWGIVFEKRINFYELPEFKNGLFEVQDEASQLIADLMEIKEGDRVLDFCAGAGGKTLAFAHKMNHKGQIYLHDIRTFALAEAKKRLGRAGIQNAQILPSNSSEKNRLKNKMDWVLVDVPCSGSGTLRRNPDLKWKFDPAALPNLIQDQKKIFKEAVEYLSPKGRIVYATCSILPDENEKQIHYFQEKFGLRLVGTPFQSFPSRGGMDGFFGAVLERKQ
ncbi:MAG TPA: RsmB/NOP family class I SAM-dependent RNA methyltransferase [Rhabdochlamydiaceae bacterium]|nr:RsmB/NOP family class I SAM-dependent RNA methyltransferase [Rhabdochlamydiaceae bacterium]